MVEADRGGEVHFGAQRLKEVGPAGDARYSAGVQERTFTAESGQENFLKNS